MKKFQNFIIGFAGFAFVMVALAQTNSVPELPPLPHDKGAIWEALIMIVSPLVVWGVSKIPNLPSPLLPTITPLVGLLLGLGLNFLAGANLAWVDMVKAGALAVFIREVFNQWVTKQLISPPPAVATQASKRS